MDEVDADAVVALRVSGMILEGKSRTKELGMDAQGFTVHLGQVRSPWDVALVPVRSSSSSAAAVSLDWTH